VISLVSCGMGFALVPSSLRNLKRTGVRYRQLRGKAASIELGILRLRNSDTPLKERFVEALKARPGCRRLSVGPGAAWCATLSFPPSPSIDILLAGQLALGCGLAPTATLSGPASCRLSPRAKSGRSV